MKPLPPATTPTMRKNRSALLGLWLLSMMLPTTLSAQIVLSQGKKLPKMAQENDWFLETKDNHIWHFWKGKWSMFRVARCTDASICHQFLLLHFEDGSMDLLRANGKQAKYQENPRFQFQCYDSISTMEYGTDFMLFDHHGKTLAEVDMRNCPGQHMVQLQGKAAFCVPRFIDYSAFGAISCTELKDWGMLGTNGQWLIEPIYDGPFRFQNGFAEVSYYGQKRKINERGESVE